MPEDSNTHEPPASLSGTDDSRAAEPYFFTATPLKLVVMSLATSGIYQIYWFYKNWALIKDRTGEDLTPFWRAFFCPLWAYSFFRRVKSAARENGVPESLPGGLLAIAYVALGALGRLPDPYWALVYLNVAALLPANSVALRVNRQRKPDFENNGRFSGWNWAGVAFAGAVLALILFDPIGLDEPPADIASPAMYDAGRVRFSYPRNWTVSDEEEEGGVRSLTIESPGSASLIMQIVPSASAVSLSEFAQAISAASEEEGASINFRRNSIAEIENSAFSPSRKGLRETSTVNLAGITVPLVSEYYKVVAGDRAAFLLIHSPAEDLGKVKPGFDLILRSLVIE